MDKYYILDKKIKMSKKMSSPLYAELLNGFTHASNNFSCENSLPSLEISAGNPVSADLNGYEFVINITESGLYISADNFNSLVRGYLTMLDKIEYIDNHFVLKCGTYREKPKFDFRCVHICVFPETTLDYLKKYVRVCGIAKYSHIILEFWGMYKFSFMKELGWSHAYSKEDLKPVINDAKDLGMEVIPMFNMLGHAAQSRAIFGKHVVLDQNPALESLFMSDGWVWNFKNGSVYSIIQNAISELCEICGDGGYFHIGCDEAIINNDFEGMCSYINKINSYLRSMGRRAILWADMMLYDPNTVDFNAVSEESAQLIINLLDKDIILGDWHYDFLEPDWKSSKKLKESGFDVTCSSWHNKVNVKATIDNIEMQKQFGFIHTTWHTMNMGFPAMVYGGMYSWGGKDISFNQWGSVFTQYVASLARKCCPVNGNYTNSGWCEKQI